MFRLTARRPPEARSKATRSAMVSEGWVLACPQKKQTLARSCGVACCSMVIGMHTGRMPGERDLAERYGVDVGQGTSYVQMRSILWGEIGVDYMPASEVTPTLLKASLQAGHPLIAGVAVRGGLHAVVISGLLLIGGGDVRVVVNDPVLGLPVLSPISAVEAALENVLMARSS